MGPFYVGVDVGGTKIACGLVDSRGQIANLRTVPSQTKGASVVEAIWNATHETVLGAGASWEDIAGIGIGAPGLIDPDQGEWWGSTNLVIPDPPVPLGAIVGERSGRPTFMDNDVKAGALGEFHFGYGKSLERPDQSLLFISVGTGLGAGLVRQGKVYRGRRDAGEIGHIPMDPEGYPCGCGQRGCLETIASGKALSRWAREAVEANWSLALWDLCGGDLSRLDGGHVFAAATGGDPVAEGLISRLARGLAVAVLTGHWCYDPDLLVLGGGVVARAGEYLSQRIESAIHELSPTYAPEKGFVVTNLAEHAGVLGAAAVAVSGVSVLK